MKKLHVWSLLLITFCFVHTGYAQEELTREICDEKAEELLRYRDYFKYCPRDVIDAMVASIAPCADLNLSATSPMSAYVRGLLHYQNRDFAYYYGLNREMSELYLFRASYNNYPPGMFTDGIYELSNAYITKGTARYDQIFEDFEELLTLGYETDAVNYVLGYLHLKNLLTRNNFTSEASINKAKMHFENSNYPMAKHWLAIMHYFGYGVPEDKAKGLQMLSDNDILNSQTLFQYLQNNNNDWIPISAEERLASIENFGALDLPDFETLDDQVYHGHFIEYDWADKGVRHYIPMTLSIQNLQEISSITYSMRFEITMNGVTVTKDAFLNVYSNHISISISQPGKLYFPPLENLLQDHPDITTLTYSTQGIALREAVVDGKLALIGRLGADIVDFNEEAHMPIGMVLYPENTSGSLLQNDINSSATMVLDKNFAVISPNPIGDQFTITYTLDQAATVEVAIYDFFGQQKISVPTQKNTAEGTQTITVESGTLISGTYIVQMIINGQPYSKTVIKL